MAATGTDVSQMARLAMRGKTLVKRLVVPGGLLAPAIGPATWKKGINNMPGEPVVLPESITWTPAVSMDEVTKLKLAVKMKGNATPYEVDLMRYQQWRHVNDVLERPLEESYQAKVIPNFK